MSEHARLSPSNHRWPHCPGSVREEAAYPDISGEAAIDGTGSHLLLEECMKNNVRAEAYDGQIIGANHPDQPMGWMVSIDRIERVQQGLDYIVRRHGELLNQFPDAEITILPESKSNPGEQIGRDDWYGTCDITITVTVDAKIVFLEVIDYKDGRGWVDVKNNTQLLSYLFGKIDLKDNAPLSRVTIVQPKTNPTIRYQDLSSGDIYANRSLLNEAAAKTDDPNAPLVAGKHCTWCKHGRAKNCTTASEKSLKEVKSMATFTSEDTKEGGLLFEVIEQTFGDITKLDSTKLEELADTREGIMAVFDRVNEEIQRRVEDPADETITGYAMLPGNSSQKWAEDEDDIAKMLKARKLKKDEIYPAKLISPAALLKLDKLTKDQKEKIQKKYIEKKPGKLTLKKVRTSDPVDKVAIFDDIPKDKPVSFI